MRIALITAFYEETYGGNEYYLAKHLSELGHDVFIYASKHSIPRYGPVRTISSGSSLDRVYVRRLRCIGWKKKGMVYLIGLKKQLGRDSVDVVHVQEWFMPLVFGAFSRKKVVLTQRITSYPFLLKIFVQLFGKRLLGKAHAITTLTSESKSLLTSTTGIEPKEVKVIPNGVDTSRFKPVPAQLPKKEFTILFVGRLSAEKGIMQLIDACGTLPFKFRLIIVGDGPLRAKANARTAACGLSAETTIFDYVAPEKLPGIYASADVTVVPSLVEPFGFVTLESMACGVPVIGSSVGGMRDSINENVGILVDAGNVQQLTEALLLMHNTSQRKEFAKNCREHALQNFDWKKIAGRYLEVYR